MLIKNSLYGRWKLLFDDKITFLCAYIQIAKGEHQSSYQLYRSKEINIQFSSVACVLSEKIYESKDYSFCSIKNRCFEKKINFFCVYVFINYNHLIIIYHILKMIKDIYDISLICVKI